MVYMLVVAIKALLLLSLSAMVHELGHAIAMVCLGVPPSSLTIGSGKLLFSLNIWGFVVHFRNLFKFNFDAADTRIFEFSLRLGVNGSLVEQAAPWRLLIIVLAGPVLGTLLSLTIILQSLVYKSLTLFVGGELGLLFNMLNFAPDGENNDGTLALVLTYAIRNKLNNGEVIRRLPHFKRSCNRNEKIVEQFTLFLIFFLLPMTFFLAHTT